MEKSMKIKGIDFPLEETQDKHFSVRVTGKTIAMYSNMYELPEAKRNLWTAKGYIILNDIAYARMQESGESYQTEFHKTLWYNLMNSPACIVVYTNRIDDKLLGIIKFCLTHGISVALEDNQSGIKDIFTAVDNIFLVTLFKLFKVEGFDDSVLSKEGKKLVRTKRNILADARNSYMANVWPRVNEAIEPITKFYTELKVETYEENRIKADRYRTQEVLDAAGCNIRFFVYNEFTNIKGDSDLDKPEVMDQIIETVSIWAPAFDIDIKLSDLSPESGTFQPRKWLRNTTENAYFKQMQRIRRSLKPDDLHKLVETYLQIDYYLNNEPAAWLSDKYFLCECGHPVNKNAEECIYCGAINADVYPEEEFRYSWETIETNDEI